MAGVSGDAVVVQPCGFRYQEQIEIIRQFREAETGLQPVIIHCWRAGGRLRAAACKHLQSSAPHLLQSPAQPIAWRSGSPSLTTFIKDTQHELINVPTNLSYGKP